VFAGKNGGKCSNFGRYFGGAGLFRVMILCVFLKFEVCDLWKMGEIHGKNLSQITSCLLHVYTRFVPSFAKFSKYIRKKIIFRNIWVNLSKQAEIGGKWVLM
jgi:hypothetical protein